MENEKNKQEGPSRGEGGGVEKKTNKKNRNYDDKALGQQC